MKSLQITWSSQDHPQMMSFLHKVLAKARPTRCFGTLAGKMRTSSTHKFGRVLLVGVGGTSVVVGAVTLWTKGGNSVLAASMLEGKDWMSSPITDPHEMEKNADSMRIKMEMMIMDIQREFCRALEAEEEDDMKFKVDKWSRKQGGGGITCVLQDGRVFEKAGVNISVVSESRGVGGIFFDDLEDGDPQELFNFVKSWEYCHEPEPGSEEAKLTEVLKNPRDWV
ncbi:HEM6-like protein [Mya arenaria]|uniref:coproporphyrinogen oxidase n=1 Tax=Mya arenaria TaxID=6604 RepID=A0ABY7EFV7_MYAAR|nr:HEM6-like protein [Mya arenaria]